MASFQYSLFGRTYPEQQVPQVVETSPLLSIHWPNQGAWTLATGLLTPSTGFLSEDVGCLSSPATHPSLMDVLESDVPQKYYLSPKACRGILRRAERRGKALPPLLHQALQQVAGACHAPAKAEDKTPS